jgi:hypothetical protein
MNWKHFLKPDWRKIVLFIIFCVLAVILWVYGHFAPSGPYIKTGILLIQYYIEKVIFLLLIPGVYIITRFVVNFYVILLVNIVYLYLLSCLIIWFYDKFRKK